MRHPIEIHYDYDSDFHFLLPGLPSELALQCLARVPLGFYGALKRVCKSWNTVLKSKLLFNARKELGIQDNWLFASGKECCKLEVFCPELNRWHSIPSLPDELELANFCVEAVGTKLYVIGGEILKPIKGSLIKRRYPTHHMWIYDVISREWKSGRRMFVARARFASAVIDRKIYVFGGWTERANLGEVYDTQREVWSPIQALPPERISAKIGVSFGFEYKNHFFISLDNPDLRTIAYDVENRTWKEYSFVDFDSWDGKLDRYQKPVVLNDVIYTFHHPYVISNKITEDDTLDSSEFVSVENYFGNYGFGFVKFNGSLVILGGIKPGSFRKEMEFDKVISVAFHEEDGPSLGRLPDLRLNKGDVSRCVSMIL